MSKMNRGPSFEELRTNIARLNSSVDASERRVRWISDVLACSRDVQGGLEIFLVGPELSSRTNKVRERLRHDRWEEDGGTRFEASRILLPPGDHIDALAATIVTELIRNDVSLDCQRAFSQTEALISFVLRSLTDVGSSKFIGLAGELVVIDELLAGGVLSAGDILASWKGYMRSARDVQLDDIGIEVKTTTTGVSRHRIEGWYQCEPGVFGESSAIESGLYLASIGLEWLDRESGDLTIERLIQKIGSRMTPEHYRIFLDRVRSYCDDSPVVDDSGRASVAAMSRSFVIGFVRFYDMRDPAIKVIRSQDLSCYHHVVSDSVNYTLELPSVVSADNPIRTWNDVCLTMRQRRR